MTKKDFVTRLGIFLTILGVVLGLGGIWVWALLGMSDEIGVALAVTSVGSMVVGIITWACGSDMRY